MKLPVLVSLALAAAAPAGAQTMANNSPPSLDTALGTVSTNRVAEAYSFGNTHVTPTMQRQKLAQAIALRDEAARLVAEDGGTLSVRNADYIQRKAARILSYAN